MSGSVSSIASEKGEFRYEDKDQLYGRVELGLEG